MTCSPILKVIGMLDSKYILQSCMVDKDYNWGNISSKIKTEYLFVPECTSLTKGVIQGLNKEYQNY